ncbi:MAG: hypothetical protein JNK46_19500, partial [Methylobacteriaceae bacterium]|nr:hypothetical protein [Methylobacteriaceae bacterium]
MHGGAAGRPPARSRRPAAAAGRGRNLLAPIDGATLFRAARPRPDGSIDALIGADGDVDAPALRGLMARLASRMRRAPAPPDDARL